MGMRVYGASDDLIEFEGDLRAEIGAYGSGEGEDLGALVAFSDGTIIAVRYGKPAHGGVWAIDVLNKGSLFDRIDICTDEDADPYSDVVHFKPGKLRAWSGRHAAVVR